MTLLSLTSAELHQQIEAELAANPALELVEERRCPVCHRPLENGGICPICSRPTADSMEEPVVFISPRDDFYVHSDRSAEDYPDEPIAQMTDDLPTYVLKQIAADLEPAQRAIAAYLLTHLDEDGFLTISLVEVARYLHVSLAQVEVVKSIIQHADPIGVGSKDPRDALLVQLDILREQHNVPELAWKIVADGMDLLSRRQFGELARMFGASQTRVQQAAHFISENLNPFPARSHWGDVRQPSASSEQVYHQPDIIISHLNGDDRNALVVEIIMPLSGMLRVNPLYKKALMQTDVNTRDQMRNDLDRASLFVKCLQQRNHTMQRMMFRLVMLQREYIVQGEKFLKPFTRARLSEELEVHESTISRAVSGKCVQLPNRRIVPLSSFFDRSLNVRTVLRDFIENETRPLSDAELVELLAERGFNVARRTVAKYRAMEGILPAHLRHAN
jgi:RNA polymerase sigma-54 factor